MAPGTPAGPMRVRVWDLPTRLFHWLLAGAVAAALISARLYGDTALRLHFLAGYGVLVLVLFRLLWGFAGPRYARFAQFVRGPGALLRYLRAPPPAPAGHNPLGALSVIALLALCAAQAGTGLFASDEVASEGPWARFVSDAAVDRLSALHDRGQWLLLALLALHLAALAYYRLARRRKLVAAMITGDLALTDCADAPAAARDDRAMRLRAVLLLAWSAALVGYLVNLA